MTQEIKLSGLANIPDDYQSPDGQLDASLNLINEDGHLRPLFQPKNTFTLHRGCIVMYIHKTASFLHYIVIDTATNKFYWFDGDSPNGRVAIEFSSLVDYEAGDVVLHPELGYLLFLQHHNAGNSFGENETTTTTASCTLINFYNSNQTVYNVNSVGNTLLILCEDGIHYFLWKDNSYTHLGTHLPELPISFGLRGSVVNSSEFTVTKDDVAYSVRPQNVGDEYIFPDTQSYQIANINNMTDAVMAKINKFVADEATNSGKFIFPFFVRYAYRLYDGSLVMHSSPILMIPSTRALQAGITDYIHEERVEVEVIYGVKTKISALVCQLDFSCLNSTSRAAINDWSDIVKSVDIFISAPLYSYDQSGKLKGWTYLDAASQGYGIVSLAGSYNKVFPATYRSEWILPRPSTEKMKQSIMGCAQFYFLKSIEIKELPAVGTRTVVNVEESLLSSLLSREVMSDDYESHDILIPNNAYTFNNRLNIFNIKKEFAIPTEAGAFVPYRNSGGTNGYIQLYFYIKQDGKEYVVESSQPFNYLNSVNSLTDLSPFIYLFYHNANALKVVIKKYVNGTTTFLAELPLKRHDFLNGAFFFDGWNPVADSTETPRVSSNLQFSIPNKLYTSEVNNPFFFPVTGINTIGTGTINGIATVTEPLSQGQFGYADIYVFCSDGIWVAQINQQGVISNINPVNKDVCTNPESITQLGSSVLYVTQRGIMQLYGRNVECISDVIANDHPFNHLSNLPKLDSLNTNLPTIAPFSEFLSGCRMLYDYIHQRIIVYNPSGRYDYAYVFSLRSKLWGMMQTDLLSSLNSYPECLAMDQDNNLVSFDNPVTTNPVDGIAITRPIKFGSPDTLKSVYELIQRGVFDRGNVKTILYGSRDLTNWHLIASSVNQYLRGLRGSPYKYFRIVAITSLDDSQAIDGASVIFELRHIHQLH